MSSQEQSPVRNRKRASSSADHPGCPKCQRPMTVKQVSPLLFASELDDMIYRCEDCGTEAKRTVKRA